MNNSWSKNTVPVGVGLRHVHFRDALTSHADLDFIEVHSENFFAQGGAALATLKQAAEKYPVSLHGVSLGLGSVQGISQHHVRQLAQLIEQVPPVMVSDHAAFCWGEFNQNQAHAGDLLPIAFNQESLDAICDNIQQVQDHLNRQILVENLSAYIEPQGSNMSEVDFFKAMVKRTGCRVLLDLNNLAVNAANQKSKNPLLDIFHWIDQLPQDHVHEIHLAGSSDVANHELVIDDHSQPVSKLVWQAYHYAISKFGAVPTLIEWDSNLPQWQTLVAEAAKARQLANQALQATAESVLVSGSAATPATHY